MRLCSDMPHLPYILSKTVHINVNWTCSHVQSMVESLHAGHSLTACPKGVTQTQSYQRCTTQHATD